MLQSELGERWEGSAVLRRRPMVPLPAKLGCPMTVAVTCGCGGVKRRCCRRERRGENIC